jgi:DNA-binding response OmpR family regulator
MPPAALIVDDEPDHAMIIERVFATLAPELDVQIVPAGEVERRLCLDAPVGALVLLDRLLGGRESYAALRAVRARRSDLTIGVLSASLSDVDRERALQAGADEAAEKPGSLDGWRALLGRLLATAGRRAGPPERGVAV